MVTTPLIIGAATGLATLGVVGMIEGKRRNDRLRIANELGRRYPIVVMDSRTDCNNNVYLIYYCYDGKTRVNWMSFLEPTRKPQYIPFKYEGMNVVLISRTEYNRRIIQ